MGPAVDAQAAVVLGQGEGGARDRFVDPQRHGQTLHQAGLAGPQFPLTQGRRGCAAGSPQNQLRSAKEKQLGTEIRDFQAWKQGQLDGP
jgi:hypothetical protein